MKKTLLLPLIFMCGFYHTLQAQSNLFIDNSYTVEQMVMDFFDDPSIIISNVTTTGSSSNIAFFDAGGTDLGLDAGIVFCNGEVNNIANAADFFTSGSIGVGGDVDIDLMSSMSGSPSSQDAIAIEFDFTVMVSDTMDFNYVFGSEEYPEFANSTFNDAFGFFISGPGTVGPFSNNAYNISTLPGTTTEVAINSVNDMQNSQYYIDNGSGQHIVYDGFTTSLPASFVTVANETYHVKMVIADRGDSAFDSGIFLSFQSLAQDSVLVPPAEFSVTVNDNMLEVLNESKYARTYSWDFGNGEVSSERNPSAVMYSTPGDYTVTLTTQNYCCTDTYTTTVTIMETVQPISITTTTTNNPLACFGDQNASIDLAVTGGIAPYTYSWSPNVPNLNNLGAGIYEITITDSDGATITSQVEITEPDALELTLVSSPETDGNSNGSVNGEDISGGSPGYQYSWSTGVVANILMNVPAGDYTVTVTDWNGCTISETATVESITGIFDKNDFPITLFPNPVSEKLFLKWEETSTIENLTIVNVLGKEIPVNYEAGSDLISISFESDLPVGTYFLQINLEDGRKAASRFIVK
ncbi:MAG: choice-of-anchor L domain-containing protein [Saprospiraceae bacterium]